MSKEEQRKSAMDRLFDGLTQPAAKPAEGNPHDEKEENEKEEPTASPSKEKSNSQKKYDELNERVCTIMEIEDMNKLRYIAGTEGLAIRELFGIGVKMLLNEYEKEHGVIHARKTKPQKGDAKKVFKLK